ncbi:hypothetical protein ZIOFF_013179 [Zingiber officinale]|uniref:MADS-box domain-containing protein n=1 Tax=Zingiber officinale TaxID=94328 RepID=A0A8J5HU02_ZINOF|nr:hypothetical protein ZIOFF_013179 [Zingiber officinale]
MGLTSSSEIVWEQLMIRTAAMARGRKTTRGKQKIEIKRIEDEDARYISFSKRRNGIYAKSSDLATLCGVEVAVVVFSPTGRPHSFGSPSVNLIIDRFLSSDPYRIGGPAPELYQRKQVVKDLNQKVMEVTRELDETKAERAVLEQRHTEAMQWFEWMDNLAGVGLEEMDKMKEMLENIKSRAETRVRGHLSMASAVNSAGGASGSGSGAGGGSIWPAARAGTSSGIFSTRSNSNFILERDSGGGRGGYASLASFLRARSAQGGGKGGYANSSSIFGGGGGGLYLNRGGYVGTTSFHGGGGGGYLNTTPFLGGGGGGGGGRGYVNTAPFHGGGGGGGYDTTFFHGGGGGYVGTTSFNGGGGGYVNTSTPSFYGGGGYVNTPTPSFHGGGGYVNTPTPSFHGGGYVNTPTPPTPSFHGGGGGYVNTPTPSFYGGGGGNVGTSSFHGGGGGEGGGYVNTITSFHGGGGGEGGGGGYVNVTSFHGGEGNGCHYNNLTSVEEGGYVSNEASMDGEEERGGEGHVNPTTNEGGGGDVDPELP